MPRFSELDTSFGANRMLTGDIRVIFRTLIVAVALMISLGALELNAQVGYYLHPTLEAKVLNSEIVLLARITAIAEAADQEGYEITCEPIKVFKGAGGAISIGMHSHLPNKVGEVDSFKLRESDFSVPLATITSREQIVNWINSQARIVVCFPTNSIQNFEKSNRLKAEALINLSQENLQYVSMAEDGQLRVLSDDHAILAAIKHSAEKLPGVSCVRTTSIPVDNALVREANLTVNDQARAVVPVDKSLELWAKRKISSNNREIATREVILALSYFPTESNADWLRQEIAKRESSPTQDALKELLATWE